jgi:hypothetical protein
VPVTWAGSSSGCPGSSRRLDDTLLWRNTAVVGVVALWCRQCRDRPGVTRGYSTDVPHCTLPAAVAGLALTTDHTHSATKHKIVISSNDTVTSSELHKLL